MPDKCSYIGPSGKRCGNDAAGSGLCPWHDPAVIKNRPGDREKLAAYARRGGSMEGFSLHHADLRGINLVKDGGGGGYDLSFADLSHADLRDAHLFQLTLRGSSLLKADLSGASLNRADMEGVDLLGVKLVGARIEQTLWGRELRQERLGYEALRQGDGKGGADNFGQAEEIYRTLRKTAESEGQFGMAGRFFYREMVMRRFQMPLWSGRRLLSKLVDLFCGYGEDPVRVVGFSMAFISFCALMYFFLDTVAPTGMVGFDPGRGWLANLYDFGTCLYFSVVTFTTLGYGDITPLGWARPLAAAEAFCGSFTLALFVVVFVKKMTR